MAPNRSGRGGALVVDVEPGVHERLEDGEKILSTSERSERCGEDRLAARFDSHCLRRSSFRVLITLPDDVRTACSI